MTGPRRSSITGQNAPPGRAIVAANLVRARKAAGLSQAAVARHLGISKSAVSQWEKQETSMHDRHAAKLAVLLGVPATDLIEPPEGLIVEMLTPEEAAILARIRRLPAENRQTLAIALIAAAAAL